MTLDAAVICRGKHVAGLFLWEIAGAIGDDEAKTIIDLIIRPFRSPASEAFRLASIGSTGSISTARIGQSSAGANFVDP